MFSQRSILRWTAILCGALFSVLFVGTATSYSAAETRPAAKKAVIPVFELLHTVSEQPAEDELPLFSVPGPSLRDVVARMGKAAQDPAVPAIVVLGDNAEFGLGQAEELRQAMQKVRDADKEVYAHADSLWTGHYLLLSGASRLSVSPTGDLWVTGLYGAAPYVRGLLDKLGIKADFLHCGAYKSAAEIFTRDGPSPEADEMQNWLLDSLYGSIVAHIAASRRVSDEVVRGWMDQAPYTAERAKAAGLIDAVEHRSDLEELLKGKYGQDAAFDRRYGAPKAEQLDLSNPFALLGSIAKAMGGDKKSKGDRKPAVGVVYVDGMIVPGRRDAGLFGSSVAASTDIAHALDEAARDDSVKAVVLRVDSPGGSAVASEVILEASRRVKAKKPLVVSMGNVAGSGGYYVACAADTIFADEGTLTGSIGVVAGKFVTTGMWNKIGVKWKPYQRGANAALLATDNEFSPAERQRLQAWMDEIYGVFKGHVTAIRGGRLKKPIDELAGGRVYTGRQALELGLIDKIGSLHDAVEFAAAAAKVTDHDVRTVPEPKNFLQRLMEQAAGDDSPGHIGVMTGPLPPTEKGSLLHLAAPYLAGIDPQHARAIRAALAQLQLAEREGVILMMPASFSGASTGDWLMPARE